MRERERKRERERERARDGRRKRETFTDDSFGVDGALLGEGFLPTAASSPSAIAFARSSSGVLGLRQFHPVAIALIEDGEVGDADNEARRDAPSRDATHRRHFVCRLGERRRLLSSCALPATRLRTVIALSPGQIARPVRVDSRTREFSFRRISSRAL